MSAGKKNNSEKCESLLEQLIKLGVIKRISPKRIETLSNELFSARARGGYSGWNGGVPIPTYQRRDVDYSRRRDDYSSD